MEGFWSGAPWSPIEGVAGWTELLSYGSHSPILHFQVIWIGLRFAYLRSCVTWSWILVWIEGSSTPSTLLDLYIYNYISYLLVCVYIYELYFFIFLLFIFILLLIINLEFGWSILMFISDGFQYFLYLFMKASEWLKKFLVQLSSFQAGLGSNLAGYMYLSEGKER